jgi:hypothetical protein
VQSIRMTVRQARGTPGDLCLQARCPASPASIGTGCHGKQPGFGHALLRCAQQSRRSALPMRGVDDPSSSLFMSRSEAAPAKAVILFRYSANTPLVRLSPMTCGSRVKALSLTGEDA